MNTPYARVRSAIDLRGHRFPAGTVIKVWDTGDVVSIQPLILATPFHAALWYAFPRIHMKDIVFLNDIECALVDFGLL